MNQYIRQAQYKKGFINIFVIIGVSILAVTAGYFIFNKQFVKTISTFEECATAGYPIMESYPEQCRTPDGRSFTKSLTPREAEFGSSITLRINEQANFSDGLVVTLVEINDSRCKAGVVCIWAGELSSRFMFLGGAISEFKEIRLGTETTKSAAQNGYMITLKGAAENTSTIIVTKDKEGGQVACTMEAKLCPDGSAVGRTGPNCEFAKCPEINPNPIGRQCAGPSDTSCPADFECVQGCGPPVVRYPDDTLPSYFCQIKGYIQNCPICLAEGTLIDASYGKIAVQDLKVGDKAWTKDPAGNRITAPILAVVKTPVPSTHEVVHLKLIDGRELFASPGHPVGDGRFIGNLLQGDTLDGSKITYLEKIPYGKSFTYDILPAGGTGLYFANGILIGSTLFK